MWFTAFVSSFFFVMTVAYACIADAQAPAAVPIEGDAELLNVIRAGIKTARSKYPHGDLSAVVSIGPSRAIIHDLAWLEGNTYCEYEMHMFATAERQGEPAKGLRCVSIENDSEIVTWIPSVKAVNRFPRGAASLPSELRVTPRDNWFVFQDTSIDLERMFDRDNPKGAVSGFAVKQDGDRVFVTRKHLTDGQKRDVVFEFSLALGALPVAYHTTGGKGGSAYKGKYEWQLDTIGRPYLAKYAWSRVIGPSVPRDVPDFEMEITRWDTAVVPPSKFTFASLALPDGTQIVTHDSNGFATRTDWVGGRPPSLDEQFRELGQALRSRGFGRVGSQ